MESSTVAERGVSVEHGFGFTMSRRCPVRWAWSALDDDYFMEVSGEEEDEGGYSSCTYI